MIEQLSGSYGVFTDNGRMGVWSDCYHIRHHSDDREQPV